MQIEDWEGLTVEGLKDELDAPRLPHSTAKLPRMLLDLETEGFTSFT